MLFDLKGKRKRLVQVVYVTLAVLFGGGLVLFGVGGNVSGGLIDAFKGDGGGTDNSAFTDIVERAERRAARDADDPAAQLNLLRAQFNYASSPAGSDPETGQLTDRGQQAIIEVSQAWERYLKLEPKNVDPSGAAFAALAYGALQDYDKSVEAQELSVEARASANGYFQLAEFAYRADQVEKGDEAAREAVRRSPSDQRNTVRSLIKELKTTGRQVVKLLAEQKKAERQARQQGGDTEPGTQFGPLPGGPQGSQPSSP